MRRSLPPIIPLGYKVRADFTGKLEGWWNRHSLRTKQYVHSDVSDIWVRFAEWSEEKTLAQFNEPHESVWYPIAFEIPELLAVTCEVVSRAPPCILGGVLITKIPPGGVVRPHFDKGWHAEYYCMKHAVQLAGNSDQAFHFEEASLSPETGDVYEFDNSQVHWVINDSNEDRITMIICMRPTCLGV